MFDIIIMHEPRYQSIQSTTRKQQSQENLPNWNVFLNRVLEQTRKKFAQYCENEEKKTDSKYLQLQPKHQGSTESEYPFKTLSASSSIDSLSNMQKGFERTFLRLCEDDHSFSNKSQDLIGELFHSLNEVQEDEEQDESNEEVNMMVEFQRQFTESTLEFEEILEETDRKIDRIQDVHVRKLKDVSKLIEKQRVQNDKLQKNIEKWVQQDTKLFGKQLRDNLKGYSSLIGEIEIVSMRNYRKQKKRYREQIQYCLEKAQQNLQVSEGSLADILQLVNQNS